MNETIAVINKWVWVPGHFVHLCTLLEVVGMSAVLKHRRKILASQKLDSGLLRGVPAVILNRSDSNSRCYGRLLREMRHCGEFGRVFASCPE
jgi:hypothetical protein